MNVKKKKLINFLITNFSLRSGTKWSMNCYRFGHQGLETPALWDLMRRADIHRLDTEDGRKVCSCSMRSLRKNKPLQWKILLSVCLSWVPSHLTFLTVWLNHRENNWQIAAAAVSHRSGKICQRSASEAVSVHLRLPESTWEDVFAGDSTQPCSAELCDHLFMNETVRHRHTQTCCLLLLCYLPTCD